MGVHRIDVLATMKFTAEAQRSQRYFFILLSVERTESKKQFASSKFIQVINHIFYNPQG
jgi:hypothetical protein